MNDQIHRKLHEECGKDSSDFCSLFKVNKVHNPEEISERISYLKMKVKEIDILLNDLMNSLQTKDHELIFDSLLNLQHEMNGVSEDLPIYNQILISLTKHFENEK